MATYVFRCEKCGAYLETTVHNQYVGMDHCFEGPLVRDYRAEGVGFGNAAELKRDREGNHGRSAAEAQAPYILPSARDMATPEDPSGQKGLRTWAEEHRPKAENKNPVYPPDLQKTVYPVS